MKILQLINSQVQKVEKENYHYNNKTYKRYLMDHMYNLRKTNRNMIWITKMTCHSNKNSSNKT